MGLQWGEVGQWGWQLGGKAVAVGLQWGWSASWHWTASMEFALMAYDSKEED